jgi:hypothetical protein
MACDRRARPLAASSRPGDTRLALVVKSASNMYARGSVHFDLHHACLVGGSGTGVPRAGCSRPTAPVTPHQVCHAL